MHAKMKNGILSTTIIISSVHVQMCKCESCQAPAVIAKCTMYFVNTVMDLVSQRLMALLAKKIYYDY